MYNHVTHPGRNNYIFSSTVNVIVHFFDWSCLFSFLCSALSSFLSQQTAPAVRLNATPADGVQTPPGLSGKTLSPRQVGAWNPQHFFQKELVTLNEALHNAWPIVLMMKKWSLKACAPAVQWITLLAFLAASRYLYCYAMRCYAPFFLCYSCLKGFTVPIGSKRHPYQ